AVGDALLRFGYAAERGDFALEPIDLPLALVDFELLPGTGSPPAEIGQACLGKPQPGPQSLPSIGEGIELHRAWPCSPERRSVTMRASYSSPTRLRDGWPNRAPISARECVPCRNTSSRGAAAVPTLTICARLIRT